MTFYSDLPVMRARQIVADVAALAAVVLSIIAGVAIHSLVIGAAAFGAQVEGVGSDFRQTMTDAGDRLGEVPLVGDGVRQPFDSASAAGSALAQAGRDQQVFVGHAAVIAGVLVALVPIALVLLVWLTRRLAFARRATEAAALRSAPGGADLLAVRALADSRVRDILAVHPDAAGAWRRGEPGVITALATLALRDAGLRAR